jgi:hypothetical protein
MAPPYPDKGNRPKVPLAASHGAYRAYSRRYAQLCARCSHTCKQSRLAKLIRCPQFEAKNGK